MTRMLLTQAFLQYEYMSKKYGGDYMARWLLVCPHCNRKFPHVKINGDTVQKAFHDSYGTDPKPDLGEAHLRCPHCRMVSKYASFHLSCENDPGEAAKRKGA
jgi:uncharacterized C2H2 Zn-finger protein